MYTVLEDYLKCKDKATVEMAFIQYIKLYTSKEVAIEAWPAVSLELLGKTMPDFEDGCDVYKVTIEMLNGSFTGIRTFDAGVINHKYIFCINDDYTESEPDYEILNPLDVKDWFITHFNTFINNYII